MNGSSIQESVFCAQRHTIASNKTRFRGKHILIAPKRTLVNTIRDLWNAQNRHSEKCGERLLRGVASYQGRALEISGVLLGNRWIFASNSWNRRRSRSVLLLFSAARSVCWETDIMTHRSLPALLLGAQFDRFQGFCSHPTAKKARGHRHQPSVGRQIILYSESVSESVEYVVPAASSERESVPRS